MEDPIGNWVWLAHFAGRRAALCLGDAGDTMAEALSRHFELTWLAEARPDELARLQTRLAPMAPAVRLLRVGPDALPLTPDSLDCVALHGLFDWWPGEGTTADRAAARTAFLAQCRGALRSGGCLYVSHANRLRQTLLEAASRAVTPWKRLAPDPAWRGPSPGAMAQALRRAGFRQVRSFYAAPSHTNARYVIPRTRQATLACERALFRERRGSPLRRPLAALGLHGVLYGGALHLASG
jgi:SAM-dependent methyltransferase